MALSEDHSSLLGRWWVWPIGVVLIVIVVTTALSYLISSNALARYIEKKANAHLKGYSAHVGRAYFHPINFAIDLNDVTLTQNANPEPAVAQFGRLHLSVHWGALLHARLVGDFHIEAPKIYVNLEHLRQEEKSRVPINKKGWQEAVESIYPLKINILTVRNGQFTYVDERQFKPLRVSRIDLQAYNIRNVASPNATYPSPVHAEGRLFDRGTLTLDGNANFLRQPHLGLKVGIAMKDVDLGYLRPLAVRRNIDLRNGTASATGGIEYAPDITDLDLKQVSLKGVYLDYVHLPQTQVAERKRAQKAVETAKELSNKPKTRIRIELLKLEESTLGYINKTSNPPFRIFISGVTAQIKNFSNRFSEGPSPIQITGRFMGTGNTKITGTFRSETKSPDFDLNIAIVDAQMPAMTDIFKAYGNFDIKQGLFSFFSEIRVKNNTVEGFVKPLFKNMEVDDRRSEKDKGLFHRLYVGLVKGISKLLENPKTQQVATEADISGQIGQGAKTSTWQVIVNLVRNAFIRAILPGFERQITAGRK